MATLQDIARVGQSGLTAQQQLMNNVSQNLANVNTKGYHRRVTQLGAGPDSPSSISTTGKNPIWGGVAVVNVVRTYNSTQESMLCSEQSNQEFHTQKGIALTDLQALMSGSATDSLDTRLQSFWSGWQAVANNPTDVGARSALLENGASLASAFRDMSQQLSAYREGVVSLDGAGNLSGTIPDTVKEINDLAAQIANLNSRITLAGPTAKTFDMLDERQTLLNQVGKYTNVAMGSDGTVTLAGQTLVSADGLTCNKLSVSNIVGAITFDLGGSLVNPTSGDLGAWTDAVAAVDTASTTVDTLADTMMTEVNKLHTSGFDLAGNPAAAFFSGSDTDGDGVINASTLTVNPSLYDPRNPSNDMPRGIAAAGAANAGDGSIAQQISNLSTATFTALNGISLSAQYNSQLSRLGAAINSEKVDTTSSTNVVQMLTNSIQQESGVSSDEEMICMITSQRAYQAAAKIVSITNEMMNTVLGLVT